MRIGEVLTMAEYINREEAMNIAFKSPFFSDSLMEEIKAIPAADVAPVRHGRWLPQVVLGQKAWDCSECKTLGSPHWKWCPVCGCKMDLEG